MKNDQIRLIGALYKVTTMLRNVHNDVSSLIRSDGQMSNGLIPKADRPERSIDLLFLFFTLFT